MLIHADPSMRAIVLLLSTGIVCAACYGGGATRQWLCALVGLALRAMVGLARALRALVSPPYNFEVLHGPSKCSFSNVAQIASRQGLTAAVARLVRMEKHGSYTDQHGSAWISVGSNPC